MKTGWPPWAGTNTVRSLGRREPSSNSTVPPGSKPAIFLPKRISTPISPSICWMAATAFFPIRSPGLGMGAKKASRNFSRTPRFRSMWTTLNITSKTGPPRTADGSLGLPPKPMAIRPPPRATSASRASCRREALSGLPDRPKVCSTPLGLEGRAADGQHQMVRDQLPPVHDDRAARRGDRLDPSLPERETLAPGHVGEVEADVLEGPLPGHHPDRRRVDPQERPVGHERHVEPGLAQLDGGLQAREATADDECVLGHVPHLDFVGAGPDSIG